MTTLLAVVAAELVPSATTQVTGPVIGSEAGFSPGGEIFGFTDAELARELDSVVGPVPPTFASRSPGRPSSRPRPL